MRIEIQDNIDQVANSLTRISRELVPKAVVPAINKGVDKTYTLSVRYAARDFGRLNRDIKRLKIVTKIRAKRNDWSGVVYFNKYNEQMTVEKFYTEADANSQNAFPPKGARVHGRAFTFTPTRGNSNSELWAKRENSSRRINNVWKSSKLHPLKYRRSVRNAERVARVHARKAKNIFNAEFIRLINFRLRQAGLA